MHIRREDEKIAESQRTRVRTANTNHAVFCGFLSVILPHTFNAIQERLLEHPVNQPQLFICLLLCMCFANHPLVLILKDVRAMNRLVGRTRMGQYSVNIPTGMQY